MCLILRLLLGFGRVGANLLIIPLEGSKVFTSLGELAFFHTLSNVPVNESTFGVHEIELVVETAPGARDGSRVGQHTQATADLGKVTAGDARRGFVADTEFEGSRAPIHDLDCLPSFDGSNRCLHILGDHIATVK